MTTLAEELIAIEKRLEGEVEVARLLVSVRRKELTEGAVLSLGVWVDGLDTSITHLRALRRYIEDEASKPKPKKRARR